MLMWSSVVRRMKYECKFVDVFPADGPNYFDDNMCNCDCTQHNNL